MITSEPNDLELELNEVQGNVEQTPAPPAAVPDPRYAGKTSEEIIKMHQDAEKALSRQGFELGELRRNVDTLLGLRKEKEENSRKQREPVTADALLNNPDKALEDAINSSEVAVKTDKAVERVDELERRISRSAFETKYPNYASDVVTPEFQSWVKASRARQALFMSLDNNFDFDSGVALWEMWDEYQNLTTPKTEAQPTRARAKVVKNSSSEKVSGPILSRAKLQALQIKAEQGDPAAKARWEDPAFQEQRLKAYADGRVK